MQYLLEDSLLQVGPAVAMNNAAGGYQQLMPPNINSGVSYNYSGLAGSNTYMDISDNGAPTAPMPMDQQKHHQTMMWNQNQYMADSGIQSSVTTRVRN